MWLPSTDCDPNTCPNERLDIEHSTTIEITSIEDSIYVRLIFYFEVWYWRGSWSFSL